MAADFFLGGMRHPIAIALWLAVVVLASVITYRTGPLSPPIRPFRLVAGYLAALVVCAALAASSAYVSREEAATVWHVPSEHYREAIMREFWDLLGLFAFLAGIGIALVGVPVIFSLARAGRAQVGWVLLASAAISIAVSVALGVLFFSFGAASWFRTSLEVLGYLLGTHLLLSLGFCLGAGLPWRTRPA